MRKLFVQGLVSLFRSPFRQNGKWAVRSRNIKTGKVTFQTLKATNRTAAMKEVQQLAEKERLKGPDALPATVEALVDAWMRTVDVRPVTRRDYEGAANVLKAALGPGKMLSDITLADLEKLLIETWADLKGQTKTKYRALLARIWKHAIKHGHAKVNFPLEVEVPKKWKAQIKQAKHAAGRALTIEEAQKLLQAAREDYQINYTPKELRGPDNALIDASPPAWLWWFIFISLRTGLRRSNVLPTEDKDGLKWRHLDLTAKTIRIPAAEMKNGEELHLPLHEELVTKLKKLQASLGRVPHPDEQVISGFVEGMNLSKTFRAALRRAGLDEKMRPHDLRHVYASWIGESCPEAVTRCLLHHSGGGITGHYDRHQNIETLRKGVNSLPSLLMATSAPSSVTPLSPSA